MLGKHYCVIKMPSNKLVEMKLGVGDETREISLFGKKDEHGVVGEVRFTDSLLKACAPVVV